MVNLDTFPGNNQKHAVTHRLTCLSNIKSLLYCTSSIGLLK